MTADKTGWEFVRELEAILYAEDPVRMKKRIYEARSMLVDNIKKQFGPGSKYDGKKRCLTSANGKYTLQWRIRHDPDMPISYHNQQTSRGCVTLIING